MAVQGPSTTIHASSVSLDGKAVLILGASGTGKSSLALQLIAYGAALIADDRTGLQGVNGTLQALCPAPIKGLIEARGVGILRLPVAEPTPVTLIVDLNKTETARLPQPHSAAFLGITRPCLWYAPSSHFAAAVLQCLRHGISHDL
ncbi:MAG: HPr kinase/phosphatase C-terminal domain-containing protein [Sulfitobacter sp.]